MVHDGTRLGRRAPHNTRTAPQLTACTSSRYRYKNEIALKEGADGGRISGVASDTLVFSQLLGRDRNQKLWAVAKNKWGTVKTREVTIRVPQKGEEAGEAVKEAEPDDVDDAAPALEKHSSGMSAALKDISSGVTLKSEESSPGLAGLTPVKKPSMMDRMSKTMSFGKKGSSPGSSAKLAPELLKGESFKELEELERSDSIYPNEGPVSQAADL